MWVRLTLCFREHVKEFSLRERGDGVSNGVAAVWGRAKASGMLGRGDGVQIPSNGALWWLRRREVPLDAGRKLLSFWVLVGLVLEQFVQAVGGAELTSGCAWGGWPADGYRQMGCAWLGFCGGGWGASVAMAGGVAGCGGRIAREGRGGCGGTKGGVVGVAGSGGATSCQWS